MIQFFRQQPDYQYLTQAANREEGKTVLPDSFTPSENDVICSRAKVSQSHPGNLAFNAIINSCVSEYANASGKIEKSIIVSNIINTVRSKSPNGGFVKQIAGQWYEIGTSTARERVSQALRDRLSGKYRSSSSSKRKRKNEINAEMNDHLDAFVESNQFVAKIMRTLSGAIKTHARVMGDVQLGMMMNRMNSEILNELKKTSTMILPSLSQ
ncbi:unnamed protein product [Cylindrotheca closterium]|uniref:DUF6824 domain-containing protein n=1 Tax=Cylindrotheca closterium TaxID=2856 RepID=A0AAD2CRC6_9STRA|nr:unnamed protein product [Cylindrotheca closterium]